MQSDSGRLFKEEKELDDLRANLLATSNEAEQVNCNLAKQIREQQVQREQHSRMNSACEACNKKIVKLKDRLVKLQEERCLVEDKQKKSLCKEIAENERALAKKQAQLQENRKAKLEQEKLRRTLNKENEEVVSLIQKLEREIQKVDSNVLKNAIPEAECEAWTQLLRTADEEFILRTLKDQKDQLLRKRSQLEELRKDADPKIKEEYENLGNLVESHRKTLQAQQCQLDELILDKRNKELQRHESVSSVLRRLNGHLSEIYRQLTVHGDCHLSFSNDRKVLFNSGINFQVKPDRTHWREFGALSGGQQALAALALTLSFQECFSSPFYLFDEIDASLDVCVASRVANLIRQSAIKLKKAQFIVVSLRPEFYERGNALVGAYHLHSSSHAVFLLCN